MSFADVLHTTSKIQVLEISGFHVHVSRLGKGGREPNGSKNLGHRPHRIGGNLKVIEIRERRTAEFASSCLGHIFTHMQS